MFKTWVTTIILPDLCSDLIQHCLPHDSGLLRKLWVVPLQLSRGNISIASSWFHHLALMLRGPKHKWVSNCYGRLIFSHTYLSKTSIHFYPPSLRSCYASTMYLNFFHVSLFISRPVSSVKPLGPPKFTVISPSPEALWQLESVLFWHISIMIMLYHH